MLGTDPYHTSIQPFLTGLVELMQFSGTSSCFIFKNSADKTTFVEQLHMDNQRMFQMACERRLILHMIPGIFELSCNYDIKFGDYVTRCLLKKTGLLSKIHQQFLLCNVLFQRQVKKCQNQIKNSYITTAIRDPIQPFL